MKKVLMPVMVILMVASIVFAAQGVIMHNKVTTEEVKFHQLQADYFIQAKSVRDSAPANSALNQNLVSIQQYPSTLLQLKLVGVGKILTGIFVLLFGILIALIIMPVRLAQLIK